MSRKPTLKQGPASSYASPNEIIREFDNGKGHGGLISLRNLEDGTLVVDLYRVDGPVVIHAAGQAPVPAITPTARGYLATAAAEARAAGVDAETQDALDAIARLGIR